MNSDTINAIINISVFILLILTCFITKIIHLNRNNDRITYNQNYLGKIDKEYFCCCQYNAYYSNNQQDNIEEYSCCFDKILLSRCKRSFQHLEMTNYNSINV